MNIKICGINNHDMLGHCLSQNVHSIGLNFVPNSRRRLTLRRRDFMATLRALDPRKVRKVGVFRNQTAQCVRDHGELYALKILQFHGEESPSFLAQFPEYTIYKAFCLGEKFNVDLLETYVTSADLFLFDSHIPGSGQLASSQTLKMAVEKARALGKPFAIAGGINSGNIQHFYQRFPDATFFDIASGVEDEGRFSSQKLTELYNTISS